MCLHFIIYIYCNPVFHLALCRPVYAVRERRMKWQLRMLMNKTWLLIPGCWADTQIEPLSSACQKFSGEVLQRIWRKFPFLVIIPPIFLPKWLHFRLYLFCLFFFFQFTFNIHSTSLYYLEFNWLFLFFKYFSPSPPLFGDDWPKRNLCCGVISQ